MESRKLSLLGFSVVAIVGMLTGPVLGILGFISTMLLMNMFRELGFSVDTNFMTVPVLALMVFSVFGLINAGIACEQIYLILSELKRER